MPLDPLADWVRDARQQTIELAADLSDEQMLGPRLAIVNPPLWELGHVAWFQEKWVRRRAGAGSIRADADALYDSAAIPHDTRWDLPLPDRPTTLRYLDNVCDLVLEQIEGRRLSPQDRYFITLSVFHEDMHAEAFTWTRQTLGYSAPGLKITPQEPVGAGGLAGDVILSGGTFPLGASPDEPFVFDNEKWAHAVEVAPFRIARGAVTQAEFAAFVDEGGYAQPRFWSAEGWRWREQADVAHPAYWKREAAGRWLRRHFDRWLALEPHQPVIHVNWYEAEAYCRWAGRRLPTEAEWEFAAAMTPGCVKRRFPWGDEPPTSRRASLDWAAMGTVDVAALPDGDSPGGCRQMIGNVWEWTASAFVPYPAFVADPYKEYSAPWFGTHKVLRGGCWATRGRLLRNTWRNFFRPERRDVFAGFRTCALSP
jgi:iron(II)-dependent oxidoreductase